MGVPNVDYCVGFATRQITNLLQRRDRRISPALFFHPLLSLLSLLSLSLRNFRIIALRIENPYSILRQIANLPQQR